jgi:hypothetical protein
MYTVVAGPGAGAVFYRSTGDWGLPCPEPVVGCARENGHPYCSWHLELMDEEPALEFVVCRPLPGSAN